jgi:hypothetical protein
MARKFSAPTLRIDHRFAYGTACERLTWRAIDRSAAAEAVAKSVADHERRLVAPMVWGDLEQAGSSRA